jgi:hypothetical protein
VCGFGYTWIAQRSAGFLYLGELYRLIRARSTTRRIVHTPERPSHSRLAAAVENSGPLLCAAALVDAMLSSPRRSGQIGRWRNNTISSQHCTRVVCVRVLFHRCVRKLLAVWTMENQIMRLLLGTGVIFGIFTPLLAATGIHYDT